MDKTGKVTILGINGHIGSHAARAFVAAGWDVTGFGRSNRARIDGVRFIAGDADSVEDMRRAIGDADVVLNALNLPYDQWDKGRMEALTERVTAAMGTAGRTLLFPGNIYNYALDSRVIAPDTAQIPQTPRGAIRVRCEEMLKAAAARGDMQVIILRAGDFYGAGVDGWLDQIILREAGKGRVAIPEGKEIGHAWAYLPDLALAFEKLAWHRGQFSGFENFHFHGHYVTHGELLAAIRAGAPMPLVEVPFPWMLLRLVGVFAPVIREIVKMRYLWEHSMELRDPRLDAILGPNFGTSFAEAMRTTIAPLFAEREKTAA